MSRPVKIATVSFYLLNENNTVEKNLKRAIQYVDEAGKEKCDIICLPEFFPFLRISGDYLKTVRVFAADCLSKLKPFQRLAKKYAMNLIATLPYLDSDQLFNIAFLIDRNGKISGEYRKTHLAGGEDDHIVPGNELEVLTTDFGKIGIGICMDLHFPEIPRIYALKGAEIVFMPTMAYGPSEDFLVTLFRSRAMDNQIFVAVSNFSEQWYLPGKEMGRAMVIGRDGVIRADSGNMPGVVICKIDLDEHVLYWGDTSKYANLKEVFFNKRRPELYHELVK